MLSTRKGLTVEIGNTDAEGRLVLCDALALADAEQPDLLIDFATLTGAARIALGPELPALFGTDERIGGRSAPGRRAGARPVWPMPLWMGYDDELSSKIADLNNVAASGLAGAIFAALFLKRFVTATRALAAPGSVRLESQGAARAARSAPRRSRSRRCIAICCRRYGTV